MGISRDLKAGVGGSKLQFGDVSPSKAADEELRWFFNEAESAVEQPSNFIGLLAGLSPTSLEAVEERAEAMHAAGKVRKRLEALSTTHALVLEALYRERVWPRAVTRALGDVAGVIAASATIRVLHLRALAGARTEADTAVEWLEELVAAKAGVLATWRKDAERDCVIALCAYERVRGKGGSVVPDEEVE
jgi:hypothetical protein